MLLFFGDEEDDQYLATPRGRMDRVRSALKEAGIRFISEDRRNTGAELDVTFRGTLREEQERAFKALSSGDIGVYCRRRRRSERRS